MSGPAVLSGPKAASIWSKVLGKEIKYAGDNLDIFEGQMRKHAPSWAAFDIRMMFQGYLGRGFVAQDDDTAILTKLIACGSLTSPVSMSNARVEPTNRYMKGAS